MNYILFDDQNRTDLLPLVFIRPIADIRIGIITIREKWEFYLKANTSTHTEPYLQKKYPIQTINDNMFINGSVLPNELLISEIRCLKSNEKLIKDDVVVAFRTSKSVFENSGCNEVNCTGDIVKINNTWEIFSKNDFAIREDFKLLTKARKSEPISDSNFIQGNKEDIYIEEGAKVEFAFLNTLTGPIYIGKQAVVMEGSKI